MRRTTSSRSLAPFLAGLLWAGAWGAPTDIASQEPARAPAAQRGWIGVSVSTHGRSVDRGHDRDGPASLVVSRVLPGSPAQRAGLRPGDRIVRVDGSPATPEAFQRFARSLRPDERVSLTLVRDGESRTVDVVTARRPRTVTPPLPPEMAAHLDSVRDAVLREFDSLLVRLRDREGERVHVTLRGDTAVAVRVDPDGERRTLMRRHVRTPLPDLQLRTFLPDSGRRMRFRQLLEDEAGRSGVAPPPSVEAPAPRNPHLVGRSYVAGARLQTLNPGLSEYFQVDEGVLVTEVVEGSPAGDAGLRSGDVIVGVAGADVAKLEDLRRRLATAGQWPVELELVRKGSRTLVRLRR